MITGKGIYVWRIKDCEDGNIANIVTLAKNANFSHVIIKIADGVQGYNYTTEDGDMAKELAQALQAVGIEPWGYQYIYGEDPVREGQTATRRMKETGCVGFVINAEQEIRDVANNAIVIDRYFDSMQDDHIWTDLPIALSSYRYPETHPKFPWKEFGERLFPECDDFYMPQVYWMEAHDPAIQLRKCFAQYAKITDLPILPTGSAFCEHGWCPTDEEIEEFAVEARGLGLPGINFWEWSATRRDGFWKTVRDFDFSPEEPVSPNGENCCEELRKDLGLLSGVHHALNDYVFDEMFPKLKSIDALEEVLAIHQHVLPEETADKIAGLTADLGILRVRELAHTREHNADLERIQGELDLDDDMFLIHKGLLEELQEQRDLIWQRLDIQRELKDELIRRLDELEDEQEGRWEAYLDNVGYFHREITKLKTKTIPECNHSHRGLFSWLFNRR